MVAIDVAAPPSPEDKRKAEDRRKRLIAALYERGLKQVDLFRMLVGAGDRTSPATVSNWCRGSADLSEVQIRGLLSMIGVDPATYSPDDDVVRSALEDLEARARLPRAERNRPRRPKKNADA